MKVTPVKLISLSMGKSPWLKAFRFRIENVPSLSEKVPPDTFNFIRFVGFSEVSGRILKIPFLLLVNVLSTSDTSPTPNLFI